MIAVDNRQSCFEPQEGWVEKHCSEILNHLNLENYDLSISLVDNLEMTELKKKYLGEATPTDVLAFPLADEISSEKMDDTLGDVVVCPAQVMDSKDIEAAILKLLVHGILHLVGHDHYEAEEKKQMFKLQDEIIKKLS